MVEEPVEIICGTGASLPRSTLGELAAYRYRVFVETLGWSLPAKNRAELDEFDGPDTAYVIARNEQSQIQGCARLLPTTGAYLLAKVFPQLLREPPPAGEEIWELSRFAAMDCSSPQRLSQVTEINLAEQLLAAAFEFAMRQGVKRFITVSPLGIERLLRRLGVHAHRAGPPVLFEGRPLFACWIEVDRESLHLLRRGLAPRVPPAAGVPRPGVPLPAPSAHRSLFT